MSETARQGTLAVEWGVAVEALPGEQESGDQSLVAGARDGTILLAGVDGLGHGDEAMIAATRAITTLRRHADEGVLSLMRRCHDALVGTRGAVMTLAKIAPQEGTLTWLGVGNVAGVLVRVDREADPARESVLLRGGVVGYTLPPLSATVVPIVAGDLVIFATDGVRAQFAEGVLADEEPAAMARRLLRQFGTSTDDALVLVARYTGEA
jgi:negative regulator of sigma-B (phosphoserine phosphatase)